MSISSMAWRPNEVNEALAILAKRSVEVIDITPWEYIDVTYDVSSTLAKNAFDFIGGFKVQGLQGLTYNWNVNVFQSHFSGDGRFLECILANCELAKRLGATFLVYGSPASRDYRSFCGKGDALRILAETLQQVADMCLSYQLTFCLEPASADFGEVLINDFLTASNLCDLVSSPALGINLDLGHVASSGPGDLYIDGFKRHLKYGHISSPGLMPEFSAIQPYLQAGYLDLLDCWAVEMGRDGGLNALERACDVIEQAQTMRASAQLPAG